MHQPVRVGLVGAGKFGSMFLSQVPRTPGIHLMGIADLSPARARAALRRVGWSEAQSGARSWAEALREGSTFVQDDAQLVVVSHEATDAALAATVAHLQGMEMVREISSVMRVEGESE